MNIDKLPNEVLSNVLRFANPRSTRLVSRRWDELASRHVFDTVCLAHTAYEGAEPRIWRPTTTDGGKEDMDVDGNDEDDDMYDAEVYPFRRWNCMMEVEAIRMLVKRAVIETAPSGDELYNRDMETWEGWRRGNYPSFTSAIDRLKDLPNLNALELRFSEVCWGVVPGFGVRHDDDGTELSSTRENTLEAVYKALRERMEGNPGAVPIRSLTLNNLQNLPTPDINASDDFKVATENVRHLHMQILEEYHDEAPDFDVYAIERQQFEPFLNRGWLAPLSQNLVSLTLCFHYSWGLMPGYFDGHGLHFPQLKELSLGKFTIGHHDHFDWVLSQSTLRSLNLEQCTIASLIKLGDVGKEREKDTWKVPMHDWEEMPSEPFGWHDPRDHTYKFSGTWETIFDSIRTRLTNLSTFRFDGSSNRLFEMGPEVLGAKLDQARYVFGTDEQTPDPFEGPERDGSLYFTGDYGVEESEQKKRKFYRARETFERDSRALNELLEAVRYRQ